MSSLHVRRAFDVALAAWGELPVVQIDDPETVKAPSIRDGMWVGIQYSPAVEGTKSFGNPGSNLYREQGVVFFHVVAPLSTTIEEILTKAESLRLYFRGTRFDGLKLFDVDPPHLEAGGGLPKLGNWFGAMVAADYTYDILGA